MNRYIRCKNYERHIAEPLNLLVPEPELFVAENIAYAKGWRRETHSFSWLCPECVKRVGEDDLVLF